MGVEEALGQLSHRDISYDDQAEEPQELDGQGHKAEDVKGSHIVTSSTFSLFHIEASNGI